MKINRLFILLPLISSSFIYSCNRRSKSPIVVLGAMHCEYDILEDALERPTSKTLYGFNIVEGYIDNYPVIVGESKIGSLYARKITELIIKQYNPYCVIDQGTAGAHIASYQTKELVIGKTIKNITYYLDDNKPVFVANDEQFFYHSDSNLYEIATNTPYTDGDFITEGVLGTSDDWNLDEDIINLIHKEFNTSSEDMETWYVADPCLSFNIPFLGFRVISNNTLNPSVPTILEDSGRLSQNYAIRLIKNIIKNI